MRCVIATAGTWWSNCQEQRRRKKSWLSERHYDSYLGTPGANDNGSGTAALLALARRFAGSKPERTLRFVAFTNEEPPYFQRPTMGSWVYAQGCRKRREDLVCVLSLETIGYYSDEPGSQEYPQPLGVFYPSEGNFIGVIGNVGSRELVRSRDRLVPPARPFSFPRGRGAVRFSRRRLVGPLVVLARGLPGRDDHRHGSFPLSLLPHVPRTRPTNSISTTWPASYRAWRG